MSLSYSDVKSCTQTPNGISCLVKFDSLPDYVQFLAVASDVEPHGVAIFNDCMAGKWGAIAPYVAPVPSAAQLWATYQWRAQDALSKSDSTVLRCVESGIAVPLEWATYRKQLRAIGSASPGPVPPLPTRPAYPAN